MLAGEHGRQRKEVEKLVRWLEREAKPDVVHLSNAMLIGVAAEIRKLGIPVISTLSGEDIFLEKLRRAVLRARPGERCASGPRELDAFVALERLLRRLHGRLPGRAARARCM